MIPVIAFLGLVSIAAILLIYSFLDSRSRMYGNIISAMLSCVLFLFIGLMVIGGGIGDTYSEINNQTVNGSVTTFTYTTVEIPFQDNSVGYLIALFGVIAMVLVGIYVIDAILEARAGKREEQYRHFVGDDQP